jgi:hypothetical protein
VLAHLHHEFIKIGANHHPNLESHRDSTRPDLNLAPMTPTLSPTEVGFTRLRLMKKDRNRR